MDKKNKLKNFVNFYADKVKHLISSVDEESLKKIINLILQTSRQKKKIFVCGNGGSASISSHYICDYLKLLRQNTGVKLKIISLVDNISTLTAISNDFSYKDVFKYQAESLAEKGDLFIIISSSGKSENVINLARWAKSKKYKVISFTGFTGGKLKNASDINININEKNYGRVEDCHHILMHIVMHFISLKKSKSKKIIL